MNVKVCDMIMGAGKTESAITQMNQDEGNRYIFITPFLEEVKRIKRSCKDRRFKDPQYKGGTKLDDLHDLLIAGHNIATTHSLFERYNEETIELIRDGGYKLILDEVFQVVRTIDISPQDLKILCNKVKGEDPDEDPRPYIEVDEKYRVHWVKENYQGKFETLRDMCLTGNVVLYRGCLLLWMFPIDVFEAFREVIILTYLFDAQVQKYYFDMHGIESQRIGTVCEDGVYHFSETPCNPEYVARLPELIHVLDDPKLNGIGDRYTNLSSTWYSKAKKSKGYPQIKQLRNNLVNVFIHKFSSPSDKNLWTVFKDYQDVLKGKGYTKGFAPCNVRATNSYRARDHLAYCVNVFYNPLEKQFFKEQGVEVREEEYALGEMIQWIWRSAIRDGKEIWVYIPSKRMRDLFQEWLYGFSV